MENKLIKKYQNKAPELIKHLKKTKEEFWISRGKEQALELFHEMSQRIPAYRDFLKKNRIDPKKIVTLNDLERIPITNKENYLHAYDLADLCWEGTMKGENWMISSTSGSTGEPFYFPRTKVQDDQFTLTAEIALSEYFEIDKKTTLFIDCFALGVWIGGMFMYQTVRNIMDKGTYPVSMITPGADKTEAIKAIKRLGKRFDQIIIGGYAPLVKDLIDDGIQSGIDWSKLNVRYFFAAEGFNESFRDYIVEHGGAKDAYRSLMNHYGTADLGTMAHETPVTTLIRKLVVNNKDLYKDIFDADYRLPTLVQYIPELFYFEKINDRLACSGLGGIPLFRYDLKDRGGIYRFEELVQKFKNHGIDLNLEIVKHGLKSTFWNLPFVYLHERADLTVSIYSVNIYPDCIRKALLNKELQKQLSGKFHMSVDYDKKHNQFLKIVVEMRPGIKNTLLLRKRTMESIILFLSSENSEWKDFYMNKTIRKKVTPLLAFKEYQDSAYFSPGGKQKWVKRQIKS